MVHARGRGSHGRDEGEGTGCGGAVAPGTAVSAENWGRWHLWRTAGPSPSRHSPRVHRRGGRDFVGAPAGDGGPVRT